MQDTGNPVLDSVVNILQGIGKTDIRELHEIILEIANKEPGGLERRPGGNQVRLPEAPKAAK